MTRTEGHGQGGHRDRVTGTTWEDGGGERGKEVKGMEGGRRRRKVKRDEPREGWLNLYSGVQSREGRGDGAPRHLLCVWVELMAGGGQTWGSWGSTQDSGQRGGAIPGGCSHLEDLGQGQGAGWSPAWSRKGGQLGAPRVWGPGVGEGLDLEGREGDGQGRWSRVGED